MTPNRFIVREDGSRDNTVSVVQALSREIPILLIREPVREGYPRAVNDGLREPSCPSRLGGLSSLAKELDASFVR
jgi:glycosyltransferase involved in cell wall biosynthesis